jgi:ABC-type uncharacterized transport system substrate-binding protein
MEKTIAGAFTQEAAKRAGLAIVLPMEGAFWWEADYRPAFATMLREGVDALSVTEANENWTYRRLIIALVEEHRLPAIYPAQMFVELGGPMSYGVAWENFGLRAAEVVRANSSRRESGRSPHFPADRLRDEHQSQNCQNNRY